MGQEFSKYDWDRTLDSCGYSDQRIHEQILAYTKLSKALVMSTQKKRKLQIYTDAIDAIESGQISWAERIDLSLTDFELMSAKRLLHIAHTLIHANPPLIFNYLFNEIESDCDLICVGSQREGTSLYNGSDLDTVVVTNKVHCFENWETLDFHDFNSDDFTYYLSEHEGSFPGYVLLEPVKNDNLPGGVVKRNDKFYLSNQIFMENIMTSTSDFLSGQQFCGFKISMVKKEGPAVQMHIQINKLEKILQTGGTCQSLDRVTVILYHCPNFLAIWKNRPRKHGWPSTEVLDRVASLMAFLVAKGVKGSPNEDLQWRICFNLGETHLIHSLNNTQNKVYIMLKLIAKNYLKPFKDVITSFIVKNVVFWLAESQPQENFTPENLNNRLEDALRFLRSCIEQKKLDYYMIPERNLLKEKLSDHEQLPLIAALNVLLGDRPENVSDSYTGEDIIDITIQNCLKNLNAGNKAEIRCQCVDSVCSVEELCENIDMSSSGSTVKYYTSYFTYFLRALWKFSLKNITDPLSIKLETSKDPLTEMDDFDAYVCPTCIKLVKNGVKGRDKDQSCSGDGSKTSSTTSRERENSSSCTGTKTNKHVWQNKSRKLRKHHGRCKGKH